TQRRSSTETSVIQFAEGSPSERSNSMFSTTHSRRMRAPRSASLATLMLAAVVGTVFATGAGGFHGAPLARGTTGGPMQFNVGDIKLQTKSRVDFAQATVTIDPL